jgi:hypothetical protein
MGKYCTPSLRLRPDYRNVRPAPAPASAGRMPHEAAAFVTVTF